MLLLRSIFQVGGNFAFLALAVSTHLVGVGLHPHQVDDASQTLFASDWHLQWHDRASESLCQRIEHAGSIGPVAIHAADHDHAWQLDFFAVAPHPLSHDL